MEPKVIKVKELPSEQKYWFFRTEGGTYYPDFCLNGYVAYGFDEFNKLEDFSESLTDPEKTALKEKFSTLYPDEKRPGLAVNQMILFVSTMNIGDIILIPSAFGDSLSIGVIESNAYIYTPKEESEDDILDDDDIGYKQCPYVKRRNVKWLSTIKKDKLDPHLFKLMCARNTITDATNYDMYIDRKLYPVYLKNNKVYVSLRVEQTAGISAFDMSTFLHSSLELLNLLEDDSLKKELTSLEVKMMVESPGVVQFIGNAAAATILLGGISLFAFGASVDFEVAGQKYSIQSDGAIGRYLAYKAEENRHEEAMSKEKHRHEIEMQKQADKLKESLERLKITEPEILDE